MEAKMDGMERNYMTPTDPIAKLYEITDKAIPATFGEPDNANGQYTVDTGNIQTLVHRIFDELARSDLERLLAKLDASQILKLVHNDEDDWVCLLFTRGDPFLQQDDMFLRRATGKTQGAAIEAAMKGDG